MRAATEYWGEVCQVKLQCKKSKSSRTNGTYLKATVNNIEHAYSLGQENGLIYGDTSIFSI